MFFLLWPQQADRVNFMLLIFFQSTASSNHKVKYCAIFQSEIYVEKMKENRQIRTHSVAQNFPVRALKYYKHHFSKEGPL